MRLVREHRPVGGCFVAVDMDTLGPDPHRPGEGRDEYRVHRDMVYRTRFEFADPPHKRRPDGERQWTTPKRSRVTAASILAAVRECLGE